MSKIKNLSFRLLKYLFKSALVGLVFYAIQLFDRMMISNGYELYLFTSWVDDYCIRTCGVYMFSFGNGLTLGLFAFCKWKPIKHWYLISNLLLLGFIIAAYVGYLVSPDFKFGMDQYTQIMQAQRMAGQQVIDRTQI